MSMYCSITDQESGKLINYFNYCLQKYTITTFTLTDLHPIL